VSSRWPFLQNIHVPLRIFTPETQKQNNNFTSNPHTASMTSGVYIYIYLLDLLKLPMKIYTIHVGKSSHPVFFTIHPHLHLRVEILVPLPWLRHERSDEDFLHLAMGAIDKVLPPWMTLYYTLLCCKSVGSVFLGM